MARRLYAIGLFALALAPSAYFAWTWRAMPQVGVHHDDALYLVGAKSLAEGTGYRIASLPGQPFQTKYPPLFSALLAPVWKYGPAFPDNLKLATFLVWLALPVFVYLSHRLFRQFGLGTREAWLLTFATALNPLAWLLGTMTMSDLVFMTLLIGCLLAAERALDRDSGAWLALAAGVLAGLAYLTRTAALPLLLTAPLCFASRRQFRRALLFMAGMLPAMAGWQAWVSTHMARTSDFATTYYTNYLAMQFATVHCSNLGRVVWYNFDGIVRGIGKLLTFDAAIAESPSFERVVAVAAIAGTIRLLRRSGRIQYAAASAGMALILLIYHYIADARLLFPLYPLLLAGLWTEAKNIATVVRACWNRGGRADRFAATAATVPLACAGLLVVFSYGLGDAVFLPKLYAACSSDLTARRGAYDWIKTHTPADAAIYAYDDPVLYLYTGRQSLGLPVPPEFYYRDARSEADQFALSLPVYARAHKLDYMLLTPGDLYRDIYQGDAPLLLTAAKRNPGLAREYAVADVLVYRVRP